MKSSLRFQWVEPAQINIPPNFLSTLNLSPLVAGSLVRRGIVELEQARSFLDPARYTPSNPADLPDLQKGVLRLITALHLGERIGIWGDFDVDGQTSTTLLVEVLRNLGAAVEYHIPVREHESHGVNLPGLRKFLERGVQIVLTCDTGITAHDAVAFARDRGVDFIITDHHTLPEKLPNADAVINPQRLPPGHPLRTLSGVGTAYLLAKELTTQLGKPELAERQLDLVALGTLADLAHLTQDARYLVQRGLQSLRKPQRVGFSQLMELAEVNPAHLNEEHIGYVIAPRLNAIGRLSDANPVVDFLTTTDSNAAAVFAARLEGLNAERRFLTEQVFHGAMNQVEQDPSLLEQPLLVLAHPSWPGGVVGIVASRLVELYARPAILLSGPPDGILHGSARSIDGIDITSAIASASQYLIGHGGHPMAAGMALEGKNLDAFRRQVGKHVEGQWGDVIFDRKIIIDDYMNLDNISLDTVTDLEPLAPFGRGNPPVTLAARNLSILQSTTVGKNNEHLVATVGDEHGESRRVIWWHGARSLLPQGRFDLAYTIRAQSFRGKPEVQLEWIAAREIVDQAIAFSTPTTLEILDLRDSPNPLAEVVAFAKQQSIIAWADKQSGLQFPIANLQKLKPAEILLIWNPPPGRIELGQALDTVKPNRVILCAVYGFSDEPQFFLEHLTGMVRYALRTRSGEIDWEEIAAILNQPSLTVELGLHWLAARGYIRILSKSENRMRIAEGGMNRKDDAERLQSSIYQSLQETAAFRAWYKRVDSNHLLIGL